MNMDMWIVWVVVALLALLVEIFTLGLAVICFSVGAVVAALAALCGVAFMWQTALFSLFSLLALLFVRPVVARMFRREGVDSNEMTNVKALVGRRAIVTEQISGGVGRVVVDGDDWKAQIEDEEVDVLVGEKVEVVEVRSVVLIVKKV